MCSVVLMTACKVFRLAAEQLEFQAVIRGAVVTDGLSLDTSGIKGAIVPY